MECNQQPFFLRSLVNIPPRCMMSTITPQLINMITEKQNKQQYESYITSCVHNGNWDAIVSYKEWLSTIQSYKPQLPETDAEYKHFYAAIDRLNKATTVSVEQLKKVFMNEK